MNGEIYGKLQHERQASYVDQWKLIDSRRNEKDNEMGYYPIVELKMVLRQPVYNEFCRYYLSLKLLHAGSSRFIS